MLARLQTGVEQGPQLGALVFGLPLAKTVAVRKDALLGAGLFFVAPRTADECVKAELFNRLQQGHALVHVAALARVGQAHGAASHGIFHITHDEFGTQLLGTCVAEVGDFLEVVACVDHQQRVGNMSSAECFFCALEHDQRVFAARKQQGRAFKCGGNFTQDEYGFFLERVQVGVTQRVQKRGVYAGVHASSLMGVIEMIDALVTCKPHSLADSCSHHQRPERGSSPSVTARVQGAQPMLGKNWSCSGL